MKLVDNTTLQKKIISKQIIFFECFGKELFTQHKFLVLNTSKLLL